MSEERVRRVLGAGLAKAELAIYALLTILLAATALGAIASGAKVFWDAVVHWTIGADTPRVLNELLVVLMTVEIMNTVRISIHSHMLIIEPFLVVGLIASIRRILVITLEAATLTKQGHWASTDAQAVFRASMIELGLLAGVVLVLVFAITLLRRYAPAPDEPPLLDKGRSG